MKKILIVDDMPVSLMMTENMLEKNYITLCANSGTEAIEIYRKERPDMVLSDLRMPGMSGYELQLKLQEEYHETIPFMFMTADHDEETESKGFENGAMDFIKKPFQPNVLLRRIANILQTVDQIQGLKKHASIDALTGLINKASSEEELTKICQSATGALLMIDLDSFKLVNDIYGHAMGDKILVSFADIIRSAVRPNDLIGRMGGDEFIAFCHGMDEELAIKSKSEFINKRLLEAAKNLMGEDMNIPLGASIGCVFVPNEGTDFKDLYKKADKALYIVKQNGKHGYSIYSRAQQIQTMEISDITNLSNIELILGERNEKEEAFVLPLESFRAVYRFIRRTAKFETHKNCILFLYLNPKENVDVYMPDVSDEFLNFLKSSLRRSDTITQSSNHQFIIILYRIDMEDVHFVAERIEKKWKENSFSENVVLTYEFDLIKP